ncbi:MAG: hypothetical protein H2058_12085 [Muricauda sp.]|nr:hypothetical protein [Allomuricauda sp.]MBA4745984.1 hypothetical protein [Allomuricauda sp.]
MDNSETIMNQTERKNIRSGLWTSNQENPFWIQVQENQVFWLGMNKRGQNISLGEKWCRIGHGRIKGSNLYLTWTDIPVGHNQMDGFIVIEIIDETTMRVSWNLGDFRKSVWKWVTDKKHFKDFQGS